MSLESQIFHSENYQKLSISSLILIICLAACVSGCASTNRTKTILGMLAGGVVGASIGAVTTPAGTDRAMHSAYWGLAGATAMGVAGLFIFDEQKRSEELERKLQVAQKELEAFRGEEVGSDPKLLYESSGPFGREVPQEYQKLVTPGRWSVYKLNQWIMQGDNAIVHQDRMIKLVPPALSPNKGFEPLLKPSEFALPEPVQSH